VSARSRAGSSRKQHGRSSFTSGLTCSGYPVSAAAALEDKASKLLLPDELDEVKRISEACEAMGLLVRPLGHLKSCRRR